MRTKDSRENKIKAWIYVSHIINTYEKSGVNLDGEFISRFFNVRSDILTQFVKEGKIIRISHGKYTFRKNNVNVTTLTSCTNIQLIDELKKRGAWNEVHIATDKEVADELRNRGYVVNAYKEKI